MLCNLLQSVSISFPLPFTVRGVTLEEYIQANAHMLLNTQTRIKLIVSAKVLIHGQKFLESWVGGGWREGGGVGCI